MSAESESESGWERLVARIQAFDTEYKRQDAACLLAAARHDQDKGRVVNLAACGLTAADVQLICDNILDEGTVVRSLVLGGNPEIGDAGAAILAEAISHNTSDSLETLHLFDCGLTDDGGGLLASSLREHMKIKELLIYKNPKLSAECEQYMRQCLEHKPQLMVKSARKG